MNAESSYGEFYARASSILRNTSPIRVRNSMEDDKTRLPAEKVPTLALNDPEPAARLERWAKEYENGVLDPASRRDEDS